MKFGLKPAAFLAVLLIAFYTPASAAMVALIDYSGFGWEDGGVPTSNPGDVLEITAVATSLDAIFGVDLGVEEATIYISGLISTGEVPIGGGNTAIAYTGGQIEVYKDASNDHDWGIFPPNAQLGTFTNGDLLFMGDFTSFTLFLTAAGEGSYEGLIDGIGGTAAAICDGLADCAYTFGGAFTKDVGVQIPDGYDLQIDGTLEVDAAVSTETVSFGAVKALYKD